MLVRVLLYIQLLPKRCNTLYENMRGFLVGFKDINDNTRTQAVNLCYTYIRGEYMLLFGKKVEVYQSRNSAEFKAVKKMLKQNGISYGTSWVQTELACGCGAKINMRQVINPQYTPYIWYVYVRPENEEKAKQLIAQLQSEKKQAD